MLGLLWREEEQKPDFSVVGVERDPEFRDGALVLLQECFWFAG
jgi:hypothetical protein